MGLGRPVLVMTCILAVPPELPDTGSTSPERADRRTRYLHMWKSWVGLTQAPTGIPAVAAYVAVAGAMTRNT